MSSRKQIKKMSLTRGTIYNLVQFIDMSNKVLEHIAAKYDSVKEGVKAVMGGQILEYEAKTIKREGVEEGVKKGIKKGIKKGVKEGVKKGIRKGVKEGIEGTVSILKNLDIPEQTILIKIQEQYHLSPEAAKKYL